MTTTRPRVQTQLGALRLAPTRLPGQTGQCLPPTGLLTLPGQPGQNAQAYSGDCALHHTHPVWSGPVISNPRPPALPNWPLTEPTSPHHFATTLPPVVLVFFPLLKTNNAELQGNGAKSFLFSVNNI